MAFPSALGIVVAALFALAAAVPAASLNKASLDDQKVLVPPAPPASPTPARGARLTESEHWRAASCAGACSGEARPRAWRG